MTITDRISLIQTLYNSAYSQMDHPGNSIGAQYFTINRQDKIGEWQLGTSTIFDGCLYTVCCLNLFYQAYGHQNLYKTFAVVDSDGNLIEKIIKEVWTIDKIDFLQSRQPNKPVPEITFSITEAPDQQLTLKFYVASNFQQVWNFFLAINKLCSTTSEAHLYHQYFIEKIKNDTQSKSIDEYKAELEEKKSIIAQYEKLLNDIKLAVNKE